MVKEMVQKIVIQLFTIILSQLKPETLKEVVDKGLDIIEDKVAQSPNKVDDAIVLPLCKKVREAFNIPDED